MAPNRCIEFLPTERTDELFSACECPRGELFTVAFNPFTHKLFLTYQDYPDAIMAATFAAEIALAAFRDMGFYGLEKELVLPKHKTLY